MKNSHKFWVTIFCLTCIIGSFLFEEIFNICLAMQVVLSLIVIFFLAIGDFEDLAKDAKTNGIVWIIIYFNIFSLIIILINKFNKWIDGEI